MDPWSVTETRAQLSSSSGWGVGPSHIIWTEDGPTGDGIAAAYVANELPGARPSLRLSPMTKLPAGAGERPDRGAVCDRRGRRPSGRRSSARAPPWRGRGRSSLRSSAAELLVRGDGRGATVEECAQVSASPCFYITLISPARSTLTRSLTDNCWIRSGCPVCDLPVAGVESRVPEGCTRGSAVSDGHVDTVAVGNPPTCAAARCRTAGVQPGPVAVATPPADHRPGEQYPAGPLMVASSDLNRRQPGYGHYGHIHIVLNRIALRTTASRRELSDAGLTPSPSEMLMLMLSA